MPEDQQTTDELLTEIRDLLSMLVEANLTHYQSAVKKRLSAERSKLSKMIRSEHQWDAMRLMDGQTPQATIAKMSRVDQGDISRLTSRLVKEGFVSREKQGPLMRLTPSELDALRTINDR